MALQETLTADLKTAMLNRDAETVSVLRMVQSAFKYTQIELGHQLEDSEIIQVIRKEVKKRTESALSFQNAQRPDRAAAEEHEAEILRRYLPAAIDPSLVRQFIENQAKRLEPLEPRHKGELIREAMNHFTGQVDGKVVADIVNSLF